MPQITCQTTYDATVVAKTEGLIDDKQGSKINFYCEAYKTLAVLSAATLISSSYLI